MWSTSKLSGLARLCFGLEGKTGIMVLLYFEPPKVCPLVVLAQGLASSLLSPEDQILMKGKTSHTK